MAIADNDKTTLVHITTVPDTLWFLFRGQIAFMKAHGLHIEAISSPGELLYKFGEGEGISVHAVDMLRAVTPLRDIAAVAHLWRCLRRIKPQIVHSHTPKGGLLGMIAAWLARVPVRIYHIRGLPLTTARGLEQTLLRWTERISCRLAHQVICVSNSGLELAVEEHICPDHKMKVLVNGSSNGVDATGRFNPGNLSPDARADLRSQYGIPPDALVVGFVGRIVRDKGLIELVEAWKVLREEFPGLRLLVVGLVESRDPVPSDVRTFLTSDPHIHLPGRVENMPEVYAAMDIPAFPTYREGFSNVAIEAAAMELPVVATSVPGCIDSVQDGVTGTLVPPRDAQALAQAIRMYINDPELRRKHGRAGRERVLQDFRPEPIWEALHQEYCWLLEANGVHVDSEDQT